MAFFNNTEVQHIEGEYVLTKLQLPESFVHEGRNKEQWKKFVPVEHHKYVKPVQLSNHWTIAVKPEYFNMVHKDGINVMAKEYRKDGTRVWSFE